MYTIIQNQDRPIGGISMKGVNEKLYSLKSKKRNILMLECICIALFFLLGHLSSVLIFILILLVLATNIYFNRELDIILDQLLDKKLTMYEVTANLVEDTIPHLKHGLDANNAKYIVEIMMHISNAPAVAITDQENVLAFIGEGCTMHPVGQPIRTQATLDTIKDGQLRIIENKSDFNCKLMNCKCPLETAIIVPIFDDGTTIGCLKLYGIQKGFVNEGNINLATGMGKLLSRQIKLARIEHNKHLVIQAKLDALQAQVNPHFLFNTLNTINMYILQDPHFARKLVLKLSSTLRYLLGKNGHFITIKEEIEHIKDFIIIENARYRDKVHIQFDIDDDIMDHKVPIFSIQPIVHNAVIHGILPSPEDGMIDVAIHKVEDRIEVLVKDNGIGMNKNTLDRIFEPNFGKGCGIGIGNVDERLRLFYGEGSGLKIQSEASYGTDVSFVIPCERKEWKYEA